MDSGTPRNPADLPLVTLDNNALIDVFEDRPAAPFVHELLDLMRAGRITINVTMATAMEAPRDSDRPEEPDLVTRLVSLGIPREHILTSWRPVGFSPPSEHEPIMYGAHLDIALMEAIHTILHPQKPAGWPEFRDLKADEFHLTVLQKQALQEMDAQRDGPILIPGIPARPTPALDALSSDEYAKVETYLRKFENKWFNAHNDSKGLHAHMTLAYWTMHREHAVFVTTDDDFHKETKLPALRAIGFPGEILRPAEAVAFLRGVTGIVF